ncbi:EAP30/Vps36 family-domain-containing protein [Lipomyces oligophaga]|uniref:EAP30/Vps36 family-domain-containing protein n=1 Tax=Lipomyces oligophaga TaxID=45792 RepID=UPI0034CE6A9F
MPLWFPIDLTSARRPLLYPNETDILVQDGIGLYEGNAKVNELQDGRVYLTTHRLCYVDNLHPVSSHAVGLDLSIVVRIQFTPRMLRSSPKIALYTTLDGSSASSPQSSGRGTPDLEFQQRLGRYGALDGAFTWICPICSYSNSMTVMSAMEGTIPVCLTCGIKPPNSVIEKARAASEEAQQAVRHTYAVPLPSGTEIESGFPCPRCTFVNHPSLRNCELCGARLVSHNLPPVLVNQSDHDYRQFSASSPSLNNPNVEESTIVKISFHSGGERQFLDSLKLVLQDRAWSRRVHSKPNAGTFQDRHYHHHGGHHLSHVNHVPKSGIQDLEKKNAKQLQHNTELLSSLNDLESLMGKAKDLINLADSLAKQLVNTQGIPEQARNALVMSSEALSLSSPIITRQMAGTTDGTFFSELSRHIAEYLDSGVLIREGGILTLFDLYALYNRARGISLISPKDFYQACSIFDKLKLPFRLRRFKSGVIVVQEAFYSEEVTNKMLYDWISALSTAKGQSFVGVTPQTVNQKFGWSVMVAFEELEAAENSGQLCRDASIEGVSFYLNLIVSSKLD